MSDISGIDRTELKEWMDSGLNVLQEVATLRDGLKDLTKNLAEKYDVKPAILNKALRVAMKASMLEEQEGLDAVEQILVAAGRG